MLALQVIEGHNNVRIATVQKKGIRYRGRFHLPVSMDRLDGGSTDPAGSIGGAALGAMTFGAAGAIVGSVAGRRGRTAVTIKTTEGTEMVCTVASDEFAGLYVEVQRLIALAETGYIPPVPARVTAKHVFLGPFYFLSFGAGWFISAISFTVITAGLGWLALPAVAAYLDRRRARLSAAAMSADKTLVPSGS
jgi:hypothetical protein